MGRLGEYEVEEQPLEYGRVSVLFRARRVRSGRQGLTPSPSRAGREPFGSASRIRVDDETVCLKLIQARRVEGRKEFLSEVAVRMGLVHPNILRILDVGIETVSDNQFIVLPFCRGGNLRTLLRHRNHLPVSEAIGILRQVGEGVDFAHSQGIIHADIKPENILFLDEERRNLALSDFGMSRLFPIREALSSTRADPEGAGGTSAYLSPEQVGEDKHSVRSDIYSFAVVAYELLTGTRPIPEDRPPYVQMKAKVEGAVDLPTKHNPNLPTHVCDALLRGLSREPSERPSSARQLCEQLSGAEVAIQVRSKTRSWGTLAAKHRIAIVTTVITAVTGAVATIAAAMLGK